MQGAALVTLNNVTQIFMKDDGIITVPRYAQHEWRRADSMPELDFGRDLKSEEQLIVREWTNPQDGQKEVFFRNLSSIISHSITAQHASWYLTLQLWILFWELDNWPVFFRARDLPIFGGLLVRLALGDVLEWVVVHVVLRVAVLIGGLFGVKGTREEYTPRRDGVEEEGDKGLKHSVD